MPTIEDRSFQSSDGTPLRATYFQAAPPAGAGEARGSIVIVHGYCEHRGRYRHVAEHLTRQGFDVLTGDLRGHGGSGGARAHVLHFDDYLGDLGAFIDQLPKSIEGPPIILGHSMGGLIAFLYGLRHVERVRALILSSPFFSLKLSVPLWKQGLGQLASRLLPGLTLPSELDPADLSTDPSVGRAYAADPLVSRHATARWFTEALRAQREAQRRAPSFRLPVLMMHAGDDRIADAAATQRIFDRLGSPDKNLSIYPGMYHEIFNEQERTRVLEDLGIWLKSH